MATTQPSLSPEVLTGGVPRISVQPRDLAAVPKVSGGDGGVTAFHDNGGRVLKNARLVLVYWGSAWNNASTTPSSSNVTQALTGLINGPWGTQLNQYRGIGPLSLEKVVTVTATTPPVSFTDPDIKNMLDAQIAAGVLPPPSNSIDRVYCVLMPTGHHSGDTPFVGQHQFFDRSGQRVYWAWVTNDGTLTSGNSIPKVFSHEIAEALSDPDLGTGILVDIGSDTGEEIGDVCNNTFAVINGVAQEAYWSESDKACVLPRYAPLAAQRANPVLIQGKFGQHRNFELVTAAQNGGLQHLWRNNDNPFMPWSAAVSFGSSAGLCDGLSLIESNFGSPGNLEVIGRFGNGLKEFWRDSGPGFHWNGPGALSTVPVSGDPVLIQSRFGTKGNFELVVPAAAGGLVHYWRNNDDASLPWSGPTHFGASLGAVDAVTMIQSNYGNPGNLEVIARAGDTLHFLWRDSGPGLAWNGPFTLMSGVAGNPVLIQSRFGHQGNLELVVPSVSSGLLHFWRNNDVPSLPWSAGTHFGDSLGKVDAVSFIESNYSSPGNFEVIARAGTSLQFLWRDSGPAFSWNGPFLLQSTVW